MSVIDQKTIETIRMLSIDAVQKANSGHPGLPMGAATMAYVLWSRHLKGSATDPNWVDRDRFVLSAGHGSVMLYSLLHLFGYDMTMDDIKRFRQLESRTPGHPEYGLTTGVETTTGPLGQGISNAVGMAIAEKRLAEEFNTNRLDIIDHYTYVIAGDGDLMEGVASEAASLAGHLKLGKLIVLYDDNGITIDGSTALTFTEDVLKRFDAYGWEVMQVEDGNDIEGIDEAIKRAKIDRTKPTLISVKTVIGYGSPNKAGKSSAHGSPLGVDEVRRTKEVFGWDPDVSFYIPEQVEEHLKSLIDKREIERFMWEEKLEDYIVNYPELASKWERWHDYEYFEFKVEDETEIISKLDVEDATRNHGGVVMNFLSQRMDNLMGGSADLNGSTKTYLKGKGDFNWDDPSGNNLYFGIREHAMGGILNGLTIHGGLRTFCSTFLVFSDYMKPPMRLAALMDLPVIYVFTHDSIGVGEDGPTHQPIEHLSLLRTIPNMSVFRPADGFETLVAWITALNQIEGPSAIVLSRQNLPVVGVKSQDVWKGAYIALKESSETIDMILIATGSEVGAAMEAARKLNDEGISTRVVSMLSQEKFNQQTDDYKEFILPGKVLNRISIEAGVAAGWGKYTGLDGINISIDSFGASAPGGELMEKFGFTAENIIEQAKLLIK